MDERARGLCRAAQLGFRGFSTLAALLAAAQPVLAGGFLQGHYALLNAHMMAAMVLATAVLLALLAAVPAWRPGRAVNGRAAVLLALVCFLAIGAQIGLGFSRELIIHIPLGVAVLAMVGQLARLAWTTPLPARGAGEQPGGGGLPETAGAETTGTGSAGAETVATETVGTEIAGAGTVGTETAGAETAGVEV